MTARLALFLVRRRLMVISATIILLILGSLYAVGVSAKLTSGGFEDPNSESSAAAEVLERDFGRGSSNLQLLVTTRAGTEVDDPAVTQAGLALTRELAGEAGVIDVVSYWTQQAAPLASADRTQALILGRIVGVEDKITSRVQQLTASYTRSDDQFDVAVGGSAVVTEELRDTVKTDHAQAEMIAFPMLLVLLVLVFGSIVAAVLPLVVGAIAVVGTLAILHLLTDVTDVSVYALNLAAGLGLGLAIDYSLFIVSRFREELATGRTVDDAVVRTVRTSGKTVAFSGVTVAISLSALLIFPQVFMRSFAYAGLAVVVVAMVGALIVLPALLAILGHRVDAFRLLRRRTVPASESRWHRLAVAVMRRPIPVATGGFAVLLFLGAPFLNVEFGGIDSRVLPADSQARLVGEELRANFAGKEFATVTVVIPDSADLADPAQIDAYAGELSTVPGVARVDAVTGFYLGGQRIAGNPAAANHAGAEGTWLSVVPAVEPISPAAKTLVADLRAVDAPFDNVLIGGPSAEFVDSQQSLLRLVPVAIGMIAAITFVLLFLMYGSLFVPTKAIVLNLLSLTAMFGTMVWFFQDGHLSGLLGFTATGTLDTSIPILMFCLAFGVSMDYELVILSRIKEEYDRTGDNTTAVAKGLARSGGIVTTGAALFAMVLIVFATSRVTLSKLFGVGLAFAVVMDATLVRLCLLPIVMKLAGAANWWLPRPLRRAYQRFRIEEIFSEHPADLSAAPPSRTSPRGAPEFWPDKTPTHPPATIRCRCGPASAPPPRIEIAMPKFDYIAVTLPGLADPTIAIAASRSGGIGIVDVSFVRDQQMAVQAVAELARFARNRCGIRFDPHDEGVADAVISTLPPAITVAILTPVDHNVLVLRAQAERLRALGVELWLESTTLEQARLAADLGCTGVIAKGHEAGGRVSETTTFILLQQFRSEITLPIWAQGGIGEHSAAACAAAGAAGVVLDSQLALTRESRLPDRVKTEIARMDGTGTVCVGPAPGEQWRLFERPGHPAAEELRQLERTLGTEDSKPNQAEIWQARLAGLVGWAGPDQAWLLGQDAAFAARLARRFHTVGGVLEGLRQAVDGHLAAAAAARPLAEHSPLASSHSTRYPIVQGPMTRVSDVPAFAREVAAAGALPFLALALLRGPEVETLLRETQQELGGRPWGAGILGFVPHELRAEQLAVLQRYRPSFALIAGGRPDQALGLERDGVPAYLHVPSPGLLKLFAADGARRFVFEGRECGGHIGPRTSFVLWDTMIEVLVESVPPEQLPDCHVLFAGGIHDARSAAMVAAMAAPLAERGVKVGVLLGTAYLFTEEAVTTGAITPRFQQVSTGCTGTMLLETGPGHITRCAHTPFASEFRQEHQRLVEQGCSAEEIRSRLELLNLGRARIASKGIDRVPEHDQDPDAPKFVTLSPKDQVAQGMYMLGQVAHLRRATLTLAELHHEVSVAGSALLGEFSRPKTARPALSNPTSPCDIAIIGMSCLLPKAPDLHTYWHNILSKIDAITEVPADRWDWRRYFDPDPNAPDKIYSKWGGFLDKIPFDPVSFGMPPTSLPSIEPLQLLALQVVQSALDDAGYLKRPFARQQTGVIFGIGGMGEHGNQYGIRAGLPAVLENVDPTILDTLPTWTEDSFPGILLNVTAGRVANRFDLGGVNYSVDAACAASLAAVYQAVRELTDGTADMMIVGGADSTQTPLGYLCFSKTHALSPRGRCRPLDAGADGIVISEGLGVLVLKRLADAERDGDRIYAVIKGIGGSSDGRDRSLTAPRPEGQALALERAYATAGFSPATVGLIEAHGTGTAAGDRAEIATLHQVFGAAGAPTQRCAIGSVKSMIGHTKGTAGVAGLIKVALGLHYKVLPPTLGVEQPNPALGQGDSPFYINSERRPWLQAPTAPPRRAGVSAFGFGGTNFHIAVEEYTDDYLPGAPDAPIQDWPSELFVWIAGSRQELRDRIGNLDQALATAPVTPPLRELARAVWAHHRPEGTVRLAVVATSISDLRSKLATLRTALATPDAGVWEHGVYLTTTPLAGEGTIAFLYPGQGSQHPNMLRDLAIAFPEVRQAFETADAVLADLTGRPLSSYVFPPPGFSVGDEHASASALRRTDRAQPALGAAGIGLSRLLAALRVRPALTAGHSYGEYVALCAAGVIDEDVLYRLSHLRGRCILDAAEGDLGTMAAVSEPPARVRAVLSAATEVWVANLNAPKQTVISGTRPGIDRAVGLLGAAGIPAKVLGVDCGFHSPLVAPARDRLAQVLAEVRFRAPQLPVYGNATAAPYPAEPAQIAALLTDHLVQPVRFIEQIEQMYTAGARLFVEIGPGTALTGLVSQVLGTRPHLATVTQNTSCGFTALHHALAQLSAHGVDLALDRLYAGRVTRHLRLDALGEDLIPALLPATTWMVDGGSARPRQPATPIRERSAPARPPAPVPAQAPVTDPAPVPAPAPTLTSGSGSGSVPGPTEQVQAGQETTQLHFQQLMAKFLDVQQEVMTAYLQGAPPPGPGPAAKRPAEVMPQPAEPTAPQPAEPLSAPPEPPRADQVADELVRLVAERTGYPPEMLGLDVEMEADLGIDSIKRVEILAAAAQSLQPDSTTPSTAVSEEQMETLAKARTLRALVEAFLAMDPTTSNGHTPMDPTTSNGHTPQPPTTVRAQPVMTGTADPVASSPSTDAEMPRFLPTVVDTPLGSATRPLSGVVAITDDGQGIAAALAEALRGQGIEVALIQDRQCPLEIGLDEYAASLADAQAARGLIEAIRQQQGPISTLVHLLPLRAGPSFEVLEVRGQQARLDLEARSLLHLAQAAGPDLRRTEVETQLMAVVRIDGAFAYQHPSGPFQPGQGAVAGLVKTLAREWPEVRCKVVDLDPATPNASELLAAELEADDRQIEVGWSAGRRRALRLASAPLPTAGTDEPMITSDSVVLLVGGARGITSGVARAIARRFQPTIVLVGRSPVPPDDEAADTAGITEPRAVKMALAARLGRPGVPATPARVEPAYRRLLADREIRATLTALTEAGARVHYHQLDVREAEGVAQLVNDIYVAHGRIDGVIYGAGLIEDKLVEDKTTDSFDRVVQTKTIGAFALARALRPEGVKFLLLFSSISARFGNLGQGDYAAANEVLNKLAGWLDARWPGRVVSLNWGPWKTAGMVSPEVEHLMHQRGIELITPERGVAALIDELDRGRKGDVEVLLGAGPWQVATPLLEGTTLTQTPQGTALTRMLDPVRDLYLRDHCLDGHPVLPMAVAMELMAEAAAGARPGYEVAELREVQLLHGVILTDGPRPITIHTTGTPSIGDGGGVLTVTIIDDYAERVAYRAEIVLRRGLPAAPPAPARSPDGLAPFPMTVEQAYQELLFQGPLLHGIAWIEGIDDEGMVATLLPSSPQRCLAGAGPGSWTLDPVLLDSGFQLILLWARIRLNRTPLPAGIRRYRRFAAPPDTPVRCELRVRARAGGHVVDVQLAFRDGQGRLLVLIEGMENAASRSLNRLAGAASGGEGR